MEEEKQRGRAIAHMPPPERNQLIARMMFGQEWEEAQMGLFVLMGAWGVTLPGPPPHPGGPPEAPPHGSH